MRGYRKYTATLVFLTCAVVLRVYGYIPEAEWIKWTAGVVVAFLGSNLIEHTGDKNGKG